MAAKLPLSQLGYFAEWGGKSWENLLRDGLRFAGDNLESCSALEIGSRYGKLSCLLALLGARVVGIDTSKDCMDVARAEAHKWGVSSQIEFMVYDGDLDIFPDSTFDLVVAKSVLVLIPNLDAFLVKISQKLKPNGKVVFLENGAGGPIIQFLRKWRHRHWDYSRAHYFTEAEIRLMRKVFSVHAVKQSFLPPIYLICGYKPANSE